LQALGLGGTMKYVWCYLLGFGRGAEFWLRPRLAEAPVCIRRRTSDIDVFKQIFVAPEYACLDDLTNVSLVIDCGANVGYSSAYFLTAFPRSFVIAIEPDSGNFDVLQRNLASYGNRVKLMKRGVWSHTTGLVMSQEIFRDGREWSKQVRPCGPNEQADFEGVDIGSLLAMSGYDRISLLKMDVEGAEAVIFAENYKSWLDKVDAIAIELHDDSVFGNGSIAFTSAIDGQDFQVSTSGELTICRRRSR
jgi:FkbM family methyltransferase